jgi:hypothetical protein
VKPIDLSVIDTQCTKHFVYLCRHLDQLGFKRVWCSEHHTQRQSGSPLLLAAVAGGTTRNLRVGTAGVMLNYTTPFKLAEDMHLLETLFPGRLDCGIIINGKCSPAIHRQLVTSRETEGDGNQNFLRFLDLIRRTEKSADPLSPLPGPVPDRASPVWVCATGLRSARIAAEAGTGLLFHHYLSKLRTDGADARAIVSHYRENFTPSVSSPSPVVIVAVYGMCAETEEDARLHWRLKSAPDFVGIPEACMAQLAAIAAHYGVSELMIQCPTRKFQIKKRAYGLLAGEAGLKNVP